MTFEMEKIQTDAQRAEANALSLKSPFTSGQAAIHEWLVDRERELYFINLGGGGPDRPYFLVLADRSGVVLRAEGREKSEGRYMPQGITVAWNIESLAIPKKQSARSGELLALFSEALRAYGYLGDASVAKSVSVALATPAFV